MNRPREIKQMFRAATAAAFALWVLLCFAGFQAPASAASAKPNFILILADDMGYAGVIPAQPHEDFCVGFDNGRPVGNYDGNARFRGSIANLKVETE